jgi:antirestriction protein ArdC
MAASAPVSFAQLLQDAVNEPGTISTAYRSFHNYSFGNQLLAWAQCMQRGITPGPIATFQRWKELGRYVRKGEKAITLCRPVSVKKTRTAEDGSEETTAATWFVYKNYWFVLAQTDGNDLEAAAIPEWNGVQALAKLEIAEVPFESTNGNVMGFARARSIAISPLNPLPHKTRFHELAHVVLGHTSEGDQNDGELTPRNLKECEAEAVALLCCSALNLPGVEFSRGYIQSWWGEGNPIPERSAQRILKAADQILKAGTTAEQE